MTYCSLGVGCDESGVCYAAAHGQPEQCGRRSAHDFTRPPIARQHCRHYSYEPGLKGGPRCGASVDVSSGPVTACMPEPKTHCPSRQEWNEQERATWKAWSDAARERLGRAVQALPKAIPLRSGGNIPCPNCDGSLRYDRWHRGAEIHCSTPMCCAAHFNIAPGKDWPSP